MHNLMTSFNYFAFITIVFFSFYINFTSSTLSIFTKIHYDKYTSLANIELYNTNMDT